MVKTAHTLWASLNSCWWAVNTQKISTTAACASNRLMLTATHFKGYKNPPYWHDAGTSRLQELHIRSRNVRTSEFVELIKVTFLWQYPWEVQEGENQHDKKCCMQLSGTERKIRLRSSMNGATDGSQQQRLHQSELAQSDQHSATFTPQKPAGFRF